MADQPQMFLPLPPAPPLLLPSSLPVRGSLNTGRGPVPTSLLLRAMTSSGSFGAHLRRFIVKLVKEVLTNHTVKEFLLAYCSPHRPFRPRRLRLVTMLRPVGFPSLRRLLEQLARRWTLQGVIVAAATLMVIHAGRGRAQDEAEDAILERRLPAFVPLAPPRAPLHPPHWTTYPRGGWFSEILPFECCMKKKEHMDPLKLTSAAIETDSNDEKFFPFSELQGFKDKQSVQRMNQLQLCLTALKTPGNRQKGNVPKASKTRTQGNTNTSLLRKSFASFLRQN